jgi:integrase
MATTTLVVSRSTALHDAAYKQSTMAKYKAAVRTFVAWCENNGETAETVDELDEVLNEFAHHLYENNGKKATASNAFYGTLRLLIGVKSQPQFPRTRLALKGWTKLQPPRPWSPLTWDLTCLIAVQFTRAGRLDFAVGVILSFDCLLRISELIGLHVDDVGDSDSAMALRLRKTKTGDNKYAKLRKAETKALLRCWLKRKESGKLFDFSAQQFRRAFRGICQGIGLDDSYVPHSCRHGGATELFEQTQDLQLVMIYGRWAVESSARAYIQDGRALLISKKVSTLTAKAARVFGGDLLRALANAAALCGGRLGS